MDDNQATFIVVTLFFLFVLFGVITVVNDHRIDSLKKRVDNQEIWLKHDMTKNVNIYYNPDPDWHKPMSDSIGTNQWSDSIGTNQ